MSISCPQCNKTYASKNSLATHKSRYHNSSPPSITKRKAAVLNSDLFSDSSFYSDIKRRKSVDNVFTDDDTDSNGDNLKSEVEAVSVAASDALSILSDQGCPDRAAMIHVLRDFMHKLKWTQKKIHDHGFILEKIERFVDLQKNQFMGEPQLQTTKTTKYIVDDLTEVQQLILKKRKTEIMANMEKVQTALKIMLLTINMNELTPDEVQLIAMIALQSNPEKLIEQNMNTLKLIFVSLEEAFSEIKKLEGFEAAEEHVAKSDSESSNSEESDSEKDKTAAEEHVAKSDSESLNSEESDSEKEITAAEEHAAKSDSESSNSEESD